MYTFSVENYFTTPEHLFELIPIRERDGSQRVGLYDVISDTPFWAAVSNFIAGPDIVESSQLWIKENGTWTSGTPYIKVGGSWDSGIPYIKESGSWNQGQ